MSMSAPGSKQRGGGLTQKPAVDRPGNSKEPWKPAGRHVPGVGASTGLPASAYNPLSGTFHSLDGSAGASDVPGQHQNGRYRSFDEGEESSTPVQEFDSVSNNGSCSGESEDQQGGGLKDRNGGATSRVVDAPAGASGLADKRDKMRAKNEKKHQRQKERRAQELKDKCVGFLTARKLEMLAGQLVAMGFPKEHATMALIINDGQIERSVAWLLESNESPAKEERQTSAPLKLDIGEELARIADMEIRYGYPRTEVERAVVAAEGDLDKAATILRERHPQGVATPSDTTSPGSSPAASPGMSPGVSPGRHLGHVGRTVDLVNGHMNGHANGPHSLHGGSGMYVRANGSIHRNSGLSQAFQEMQKEDRDASGQGGQARWAVSQGGMSVQGSTPRYGQTSEGPTSTSRGAGIIHQNGAIEGMQNLSNAFTPLAAGTASVSQWLPTGSPQSYPIPPRPVQDMRTNPQQILRHTGVTGRSPSVRNQPGMQSISSQLSMLQLPSAGAQQPPQIGLAPAASPAGSLGVSPVNAGFGNVNATPALAGGLFPHSSNDQFWKAGVLRSEKVLEAPAAGGAQPFGTSLPAVSVPVPSSPLPASSRVVNPTPTSGWSPSRTEGGGSAAASPASHGPPRTAPTQVRSSALAPLPSTTGLLSGWGAGLGTSASFSAVDWSMGTGSNSQAVDWSVTGSSGGSLGSLGLWNAGTGSANLNLGNENAGSSGGDLLNELQLQQPASSSMNGVGDRSYDLWGGSTAGGTGWPLAALSRMDAGANSSSASSVQEWTTPFAGKDLFPLSQHTVSSTFL